MYSSKHVHQHLITYKRFRHKSRIQARLWYPRMCSYDLYYWDSICSWYNAFYSFYCLNMTRIALYLSYITMQALELFWSFLRCSSSFSCLAFWSAWKAWNMRISLVGRKGSSGCLTIILYVLGWADSSRYWRL